jgi:hypothetical protein
MKLGFRFLELTEPSYESRANKTQPSHLRLNCPMCTKFNGMISKERYSCKIITNLNIFVRSSTWCSGYELDTSKYKRLV